MQADSVWEARFILPSQNWRKLVLSQWLGVNLPCCTICLSIFFSSITIQAQGKGQRPPIGCGPSALITGARLLDVPLDIDDVGHALDLKATQASMLELKKSAESLGLRAVGVRCTIDQLVGFTTPAIILIWSNTHESHYICVNPVSFSKETNELRYYSNLISAGWIPLDYLEAHWEGEALLLSIPEQDAPTLLNRPDRFQPLVYDHGWIEATSEITSFSSLLNTTSSILKIDEIRSSCSCSKAEQSETISINPGESADIEFRIPILGNDIFRVIQVRTTAGSDTPVSLTSVATIQRGIIFDEASSRQVSDLYQGQQKYKHEIQIEFCAPGELRIEGATVEIHPTSAHDSPSIKPAPSKLPRIEFEGAFPFVTSGIVDYSRYHQFSIRKKITIPVLISIPSCALVSQYSCSFKFQTNYSAQKHVTYHMSFFVMQDFFLDPPRIHFGFLKPGQMREVLVKRRSRLNSKGEVIGSSGTCIHTEVEDPLILNQQWLRVVDGGTGTKVSLSIPTDLPESSETDFLCGRIRYKSENGQECEQLWDAIIVR